MSARSKTGGGVGTNQYEVKGRSVGSDPVGAARAALLDGESGDPVEELACTECGDVYDSDGRDGLCGSCVAGDDALPEKQRLWRDAGVSSIDDMVALEVAGLSPERLVEFQTVLPDASPAAIASLSKLMSPAGAQTFLRAGVGTAEQMVALANEGWTPARVDEFRKAGVSGFDALMATSTHATAVSVQAARKLGFTGPDIAAAAGFGLGDQPRERVDWARSMGAGNAAQVKGLLDATRQYGGRGNSDVAPMIEAMSPADRDAVIEACDRWGGRRVGDALADDSLWADTAGVRDVPALSAALQRGLGGNELRRCVPVLGSVKDVAEWSDSAVAAMRAAGSQSPPRPPLIVDAAAQLSLWSPDDLVEADRAGLFEYGFRNAVSAMRDGSGEPVRGRAALGAARELSGYLSSFGSADKPVDDNQLMSLHHLISDGLPPKAAAWAVRSDHGRQARVVAAFKSLGVRDPDELIRVGDPFALPPA
jgi:hypothetical protein